MGYHNKEDRPDFFSITTIGERGQVVVPKDAREALGLSAGDKLVVLPSRRGNGILLMKEENIKQLAQHMSEKADHIIEKSEKLREKLKAAEDNQ
jgi:AbrB family looped-hinge helix DNA binding protein